MALTPEPPDGFTEAAAEAAKLELLGIWKQYINDCEEADSQPDVDDFGVWMLRLRAFRDGVAFARDQTDDPPPSA